MTPVLLTPVVRSVELSTGVTLQYVEQGESTGVPIVMLHGVTDSWRSFEPVLPYLPPSMRVFALTQRGHGDSDRPAAGYRFANFAADVAAFLDALGLESAVIAGSSMGSSVAARFAIDFPDRVQALVLMAAFFDYRANPAVVEFVDFVATLTDPIDPGFVREFQESTLARAVSPSFMETIVAESLKLPAWLWRKLFSGFLDDDYSTEMGQIAAPTLVLWGDQDVFAPRVDQDAIVAAIAGSRLDVYAGAGHAIHWEEPARFAGDLAAFVAGLDR